MHKSCSIIGIYNMFKLKISIVKENHSSLNRKYSGEKITCIYTRETSIREMFTLFSQHCLHSITYNLQENFIYGGKDLIS